MAGRTDCLVDFLCFLWYNLRVMKRVMPENKKAAIDILSKGGILGVPTETVYGLAVKADNTPAIRKLLDLKQRQIGSGKVLTMMVADVDQMSQYALMDHRSLVLSRHYFPGELTLILPKRRAYRHPYFDNFQTIGIRIPDHEYMLELLKQTGPLLVTSANPRGEAPCRNSKELEARLPDVDGVVKGVSGGNIPSTIIDLTDNEPNVIRQGGLLVVRYTF